MGSRMSARITSRKDRSDFVELGVSLIQHREHSDSMRFLEIDLDDHIAAVIVWGSSETEVNACAKRLVDGWNSQKDPK